MRVRATRQGDVMLGRVKKACFPNTIYDFPAEVARLHDWLVPLEEPTTQSASPREASGARIRGSRGNQ